MPTAGEHLFYSDANEGALDVVRFSERMGFRTVRDAIQVDSMDDDLRTGLWNELVRAYFDGLEYRTPLSQQNTAVSFLLSEVWEDFWKRPVDDEPEYWDDMRTALKEFFFKCPWYEVYDFIEFVANSYSGIAVSEDFRAFCNVILRREASAYRFVGNQLACVTSEQEIAAIEGALTAATPIQPIHDHLRQALALLSDRHAPDYRNSMKESICAVEALCKLIAGDPKATLGSALTAIQKSGKVDLHVTLKDALHKLYGYTSDADGIRHALKDAPTADHEDAMFMLTTCSAYVSYLTAKAQKAGIQL